MRALRVIVGVFLCLAAVGPASSDAQDTLTFTLTLESPREDLSFQAYQGYQLVQLKGAVLPEDRPGTPWLPAKYVNVLLPEGAQLIDMQAEAEDVLVQEGIVVCPAQPPQRRTLEEPMPFVAADETAYAGEIAVPAQRAVGSGPQAMRRHRFATVRINPVRYVAARKELYLSTRVNLKVTYRPRPVPAVKRVWTAGDAVFDAAVMGIMANPRRGDPKEWAPAEVMKAAPEDVCDYLIITSEELVKPFEELASHRRSHDGFKVEIKTVGQIKSAYEGDDSPAKIRACIDDYHEKRGTQYVVLGGDNNIVPVRRCYVMVPLQPWHPDEVEPCMPTDLYYSDLTGTWDVDGDDVYGEADDDGAGMDMGPEVWVGRIPVRTQNHAAAYIGKVIAFEKQPPDRQFFGKMLLLAVKLWDDYVDDERPFDDCDDGLPEFRADNHPKVSDAEIWQRRMYRDAVRPHWTAWHEYAVFADTLTSWDGSTVGDYALNATDLSTRLNEGWLWLQMATHGNYDVWGLEEADDFSSSHAAALTGTTAFVYTMSCLTGGFDAPTDPCLSEAFLRNPQGGALAYMGCSRYGWFVRGSDYGGTSLEYNHEFLRQALRQREVRLGQAFALHKAAMIPKCRQNGSDRWVQFGLNLQGDPALTIRVVAEE